jgi:hypothetical protein
MSVTLLQSPTTLCTILGTFRLASLPPFQINLGYIAGRRKGNFLIINTSGSYMRRIFDDNDIVHVVAPTGVAAFNFLGGSYIDLRV